jgi:hypothetical protein
VELVNFMISTHKSDRQLFLDASRYLIWLTAGCRSMSIKN